MDSSHLAALTEALSGRSVAVIGDVVADEFVCGRVARVSREAPVLILEYDSTDVVPGGGANAANNVAALGGWATLVSVVGRDEPGRRLLSALHRRVNSRGVIRAAGRETIVKTRILAGGIHSAKQQVVRIDRGVTQSIDDRMRAAFERAAIDAIGGADAVLVSDYGSGLVTPALVARLQKALRRAGPPIPILVDSRYRLLEYRGLTACTPNESEVEQALGVRIDDDARVLERAGRELLERTGTAAVLITRGSRGMALFVRSNQTLHIPIYGSDDIADVTGAGDTVMATMTLALAAGATFEGAARLANFAGGVVVMKRGTATITAAELRAAIVSDAKSGTLRPEATADVSRRPVPPKRSGEARREGGSDRVKPGAKADVSRRPVPPKRSGEAGREGGSDRAKQGANADVSRRSDRAKQGANADLSRRSDRAKQGANADLSRRSDRAKQGAKADG